MSVGNYDTSISKKVPDYTIIHKTLSDIILKTNPGIGNWLDVGTGTGKVYEMNKELFPNVSFAFAEPSTEMIKAFQDKFKFEPILSSTQDLILPDNKFDVITAVLCHHYLDMETRLFAERNCFRMLSSGGRFYTVEHTRPSDNESLKEAMDDWRNHLIAGGMYESEAEIHLSRYDSEYFPISEEQHVKQLESIGFENVNVFYSAHMQAGFCGTKP